MITIVVDGIDWIMKNGYESLTLVGAILFIVDALGRKFIESHLKRFFKVKKNKDFYTYVSNQKRIEQKIDLIYERMGGKWPVSILNPTKAYSAKKDSVGYLFLWGVRYLALTVIKFMSYPIQGGIKMKLLQILKSNISKKFVAFLISAGVTAANEKYNLNLDPNTIYGLYVVTIMYILGQAHVDAKKAISSAINSTSQAVVNSSTLTSGQPIQTVTAPPMNFQDISPYVDEVNKQFNNLYEDIMSGKQPSQDVIDAYMTMYHYFTNTKVNGHASSKGA